MAFNLRNRHLLKLLDFTPQEITVLLQLAADLKTAKYAGIETQRLKGKNIALIFEKDLRARAVPLRSPRSTRVPTSPLSAPLARILATRRA